MPPGIFLDPSEFRRNNYDFGGNRLTSLRDLAARKRVTVLQTDVSVLEVKNLMKRDVAQAYEILKGGKLAPLKSIDDARLQIFRELPSAEELADKLVNQLDTYLKSASCDVLEVSAVDAGGVFRDYFADRPPFGNTKKKMEFPDAFTLHRVRTWALENKTGAFVIGPDPDIKAFCGQQGPLRHFEKLEECLDYINREDALVEQLHARADQVRNEVVEFVREEFRDLEFSLKFNPWGDVGEITVDEVEVRDIYALEADDEQVSAEADVTVRFTADFSYEDPDSGFYDKESGQHLMAETLSGEANDTADLSVEFVFSLDENGNVEVTDLAFQTQSVVVQEEDRGDYDAWK